jgi:SAM-dependent methyltransferase
MGADTTQRSVAERAYEPDVVARLPAMPSVTRSAAAPASLRGVGVRRSIALLRAFAVEQSQPEVFYELLAADSVALVERHGSLRGKTVVDVGAGPVEFAAAFCAAGARYLAVDSDPAAIRPAQAAGSGAVVARGARLPLRTDSVDVAFSSNVLEHVTDPTGFADELVRVVRPGGLVVLSYTNWLSPWGGHETSPFHYLGGRRAVRRYARRYGHPPKNRVGENLFRVSVSFGLRWARRQPDAALLEARPRYYPRWARGLLRVPGLREVATWNLFLVLRKR